MKLVVHMLFNNGKVYCFIYGINNFVTFLSTVFVVFVTYLQNGCLLDKSIEASILSNFCPLLIKTNIINDPV